MMKADVSARTAQFAAALLGAAEVPGGLAFPVQIPRAQLDYSPASLAALEQYLTRIRPHANALDTQVYQNTLLAAGSYLGEVMRQSNPAAQWTSPPGGGFPVLSVGGAILEPVTEVQQFLSGFASVDLQTFAAGATSADMGAAAVEEADDFGFDFLDDAAPAEAELIDLEPAEAELFEETPPLEELGELPELEPTAAGDDFGFNWDDEPTTTPAEPAAESAAAETTGSGDPWELGEGQAEAADLAATVDFGFGQSGEGVTETSANDGFDWDELTAEEPAPPYLSTPEVPAASAGEEEELDIEFGLPAEEVEEEVLYATEVPAEPDTTEDDVIDLWGEASEESVPPLRPTRKQEEVAGEEQADWFAETASPANPFDFESESADEQELPAVETFGQDLAEFGEAEEVGFAWEEEATSTPEEEFSASPAPDESGTINLDLSEPPEEEFSAEEFADFTDFAQQSAAATGSAGEVEADFAEAEFGAAEFVDTEFVDAEFGNAEFGDAEFGAEQPLASAGTMDTESPAGSPAYQPTPPPWEMLELPFKAAAAWGFEDFFVETADASIVEALSEEARAAAGRVGQPAEQAQNVAVTDFERESEEAWDFAERESDGEAESTFVDEVEVASPPLLTDFNAETAESSEEAGFNFDNFLNEEATSAPPAEEAATEETQSWEEPIEPAEVNEADNFFAALGQPSEESTVIEEGTPEFAAAVGGEPAEEESFSPAEEVAAEEELNFEEFDVEPFDEADLPGEPQLIEEPAFEPELLEAAAEEELGESAKDEEFDFLMAGETAEPMFNGLEEEEVQLEAEAALDAAAEEEFLEETEPVAETAAGDEEEFDFLSELGGETAAPLVSDELTDSFTEPEPPAVESELDEFDFAAPAAPAAAAIEFTNVDFEQELPGVDEPLTDAEEFTLEGLADAEPAEEEFTVDFLSGEAEPAAQIDFTGDEPVAEEPATSAPAPAEDDWSLAFLEETDAGSATAETAEPADTAQEEELAFTDFAEPAADLAEAELPEAAPEPIAEAAPVTAETDFAAKVEFIEDLDLSEELAEEPPAAQVEKPSAAAAAGMETIAFEMPVRTPEQELPAILAEQKSTLAALMPAANRGSADAQYELGVLYEEGLFAEDQYPEAVRRFQEAADQGHVPALARLGHLYYLAQGVPQDLRKAVQFYFPAAKKGEPLAQGKLGMCLEHGRGVRRDMEKSLRCYFAGANAGSPASQVNLALCYLRGRGVKAQPRVAVRWLEKAVEQNYAHAKLLLGACYEGGVGIAQDKRRAEVLYRQAAEAGYAFPEGEWSVRTAHGKASAADAVDPTWWLRLAADAGEPWAQHNMGLCYQLGHGVRESGSKLLLWFQQAAKGGCAPAQYALGRCFETGIGTPKEFARAVKWYTRSATAGFAPAQARLALCYECGFGVERDSASAEKWRRRATAQTPTT